MTSTDLHPIAAPPGDRTEPAGARRRRSRVRAAAASFVVLASIGLGTSAASAAPAQSSATCTPAEAALIPVVVVLDSAAPTNPDVLAPVANLESSGAFTLERTSLAVGVGTAAFRTAVQTAATKAGAADGAPFGIVLPGTGSWITTADAAFPDLPIDPAGLVTSTRMRTAYGRLLSAADPALAVTSDGDALRVDLVPPTVQNDPRTVTDLQVLDGGGAVLTGCADLDALPATIAGAGAATTVSARVDGRAATAAVPVRPTTTPSTAPSTATTTATTAEATATTAAGSPAGNSATAAGTSADARTRRLVKIGAAAVAGLLVLLLLGLLLRTLRRRSRRRRDTVETPAAGPRRDLRFDPRQATAGPQGRAGLAANGRRDGAAAVTLPPEALDRPRARPGEPTFIPQIVPPLQPHRDPAPADAAYTPPAPEPEVTPVVALSDAEGVRPALDGFVRIRPRPAAPGWTGASNADRTVRIDELGLTRLPPIDGPLGRSWGYEADGVVAGAGWLEKKTGAGEDAEPTLRLHDNGAAILGVYDGTGGSGAATARRLRDGTELSGAYVASRLVRDLVETWVTRRLDKRRGVGMPDDLATWLARALEEEAVTVPGGPVGLRGSLNRKLPTTAATLAVTPTRDGVWAEAIWAGDSRAFAITPSNGMQTLTVDDTRETDALALIRNDQPMTNVIAADRPFRLNYRTVERSGPVIFLTATDGCFGYVATPAHFEFLVLDKLVGANDAQEWSAAIIEELGRFAGDDASFALMTAGFSDFEDLQEAFRRRHDYLRTEHWLPFLRLTDEADRDLFREASWAAYRDAYEALIARSLQRR